MLGYMFGMILTMLSGAAVFMFMIWIFQKYPPRMYFASKKFKGECFDPFHQWKNGIGHKVLAKSVELANKQNKEEVELVDLQIAIRTVLEQESKSST